MIKPLIFIRYVLFVIGLTRAKNRKWKIGKVQRIDFMAVKTKRTREHDPFF